MPRKVHAQGAFANTTLHVYDRNFLSHPSPHVWAETTPRRRAGPLIPVDPDWPSNAPILRAAAGSFDPSGATWLRPRTYARADLEQACLDHHGAFYERSIPDPRKGLLPCFRGQPLINSRASLQSAEADPALPASSMLPICFPAAIRGSASLPKFLKKMVGATGIEPVTPTMST
jgi:hypothetical protein